MNCFAVSYWHFPEITLNLPNFIVRKPQHFIHLQLARALVNAVTMVAFHVNPDVCTPRELTLLFQAAFPIKEAA